MELILAVECNNFTEFIETQRWFFKNQIDYFLTFDKPYRLVEIYKFPHCIFMSRDIFNRGLSLSHGELEDEYNEKIIINYSDLIENGHKYIKYDGFWKSHKDKISLKRSMKLLSLKI